MKVRNNNSNTIRKPLYIEKEQTRLWYISPQPHRPFPACVNENLASCSGFATSTDSGQSGSNLNCRLMMLYPFH